jgi:hypothetical protein
VRAHRRFDRLGDGEASATDPRLGGVQTDVASGEVDRFAQRDELATIWIKARQVLSALPRRFEMAHAHLAAPRRFDLRWVAASISFAAACFVRVIRSARQARMFAL